MAAPAVSPKTCSLAGCSAPAAAGACAACKTAWYCSREHQRLAWKGRRGGGGGGGHKQHCRLVGTAIGGATCSVVFVGQGAGKELAQHATLGLGAARRAGEAAALKAGAEAAKEVCIGNHAGAGGAAYRRLAEPVDLDTLRATWPDARLVVKRRRCLLALDYCVGSLPVFLVKAPEGARGFTCADLVSVCARAYQWVYEMEVPGGGPAPRMGGFMLNRGATSGPFKISMHDLEDLLLHSFSVSGAWPAGGAGEEGEGEEGDDAAVSVVVVPSGIDS